MRGLKSLLVAAAAMLLPGVASASVVYNLTLTDTFDPTPIYSGTGQLTLASAPSAIGQTDYSAAQVLGLTFTVGGQTFSLADPGASLSVVRFLNGSLNDITFAEEIGKTPNRFALHTTSGYAFYYNNELSAAYGTITAKLAVVPEPASWGLMIMGVGGVGAALRRRKTVSSVA